MLTGPIPLGSLLPAWGPGERLLLEDSLDWFSLLIVIRFWLSGSASGEEQSPRAIKKDFRALE